MLEMFQYLYFIIYIQLFIEDPKFKIDPDQRTFEQL
jgi:hypothetical protein